MRQDTKPVILAELDIPIFFIKRLGDRQFVVGGGGGASKTGVPNVVYLFALTTRNGRTFLRQGQKVDVGTECPMNVAVYEITSSSRSPVVIDPRARTLPSKHATGGIELTNAHAEPNASGGGAGQPRPSKVMVLTERMEKEMHLLLDNARELIAVGLNNTCAVYQVTRSLCKGIQQDNGVGGEPGPAIISKDDLLSISFRENVETVSGPEAVQTCAVFIPPDPTKRSNLTVQLENPGSLGGGASLATAGTDGCIRIWDAAEFDPLISIKAHESEIIDMDLSFTGDEIITCARDKQAHVWQLKNGKKIATVMPEFPEGKNTAYRPRKVKFHSQDAAVVFVSWIPAARGKPLAPSVLCMYRFRTSRLALIVSTPIKGDQQVALSVSPDGKYVACGSLEGDVHIYRAENLAHVYSSHAAHATFVTDLEFTDCTFGAKMFTQINNAQCTLFSVSADRRIVMHQADYTYSKLKKWKYWMKLLPLLWLLIVIATQVMDYIGYFELASAEL